MRIVSSDCHPAADGGTSLSDIGDPWHASVGTLPHVGLECGVLVFPKGGANSFFDGLTPWAREARAVPSEFTERRSCPCDAFASFGRNFVGLF